MLDFGCRKPQDTQSKRLHVGVSRLVVGSRFLATMGNSSIHLDDKACLASVEVRYVRTYRMLATELYAQLPTAQHLPKFAFRGRHLSP